ncbi:MAG: sodium:solute symporter family protein [Clostridia bacterium]|nr:sodium:solute symporter family protein [Clostridia bacterium]
MNIYFIGMCIAMLLYVVIGAVISRTVKGANDFYVAGRRAPMLLIAGSIIASYTSTGMFMGDAAQCFEGAFSPVIIFAGMQSAGYIIGAVFFGRYLRRSKTFTLPEFFGKRFCSRPMQILAAVTAIMMMTVYFLSVMQGIGTLMTVVTNADYNLCIILTLVTITILTVTSGSRGVLITDTIMAGVFTFAMIISLIVIGNKSGGFFDAVVNIGSNPNLSGLLSWGGAPGPLYDTGIENVGWGLIYGVVWMSVCMVGPWQSSRYLMAKNEHAIVRSAPISAIGVFIMELFVGLTAVVLRLAVPEGTDSSHVMIWAAMNMLPTILGVILLTGVLSAGISSATTFLHLVGASISNDIMRAEGNRSVKISRIAMVGVSLLVLAYAVINPPSIFWIMFLGGSMAACSWMPVAVGSIFSKRLTKTGAFWGMLCGMLGCFVMKMYSTFANITLPVYLDPSLVGMVCNVIAMVIGSALTKVSAEETAARNELFVIPEEEKDEKEIKKTLAWGKATILVGIAVFAMLLVLWIIPYYQGLNAI